MASQVFRIGENEKDIGHLKLAVYGNNNGNRGLIRRVDGIERKLNSVLWLSKVIFLMLLGVVGNIVFQYLGK